MSKLVICSAVIALAFAAVPASAEHHTGSVKHHRAHHHLTAPTPSAIGAAHDAEGTGSELRRPLRPRRDPHSDR